VASDPDRRRRDHPVAPAGAPYRSDRRMAHAVFEIAPLVRRVLTAMLKEALG